MKHLSPTLLPLTTRRATAMTARKATVVAAKLTFAMIAGLSACLPAAAQSYSIGDVCWWTVYQQKFPAMAGNVLGAHYDANGNDKYDTGDVGVMVDDILCREHGYVDLGLTSGTLWATMNIGATTESEEGDYFAWADVVGTTNDSRTFTWQTYPYLTTSTGSDLDWVYISKYQVADKEYGAAWYDADRTFVGDGLTELAAVDDAASAWWGKAWQTPSAAQLAELVTECTWAAATVEGKNGMRVTGPSGASIFLPLTGYVDGGLRYNRDVAASYWSREVKSTSHVADGVLRGPATYQAWVLTFTGESPTTVKATSLSNRYLGRTVRAVRR